MTRILGIDYGERRVGLAVSDGLGITAQGLETFDRKHGDLYEHLAGLVSHYEVDRVVLGYPLSMSGRPNVTSKAAERVAVRIRERFGVEVVLWDERLTSAEARRTLVGARSAKKDVDRVAAVLILQSYMDSQAGEKGHR